MTTLRSINKTLIALLLGTISLKAQAGEATFNGYAELQVPPETVTLTISVRSECFPSASKVSIANDEIATKVLAILRSIGVRSEGDKVTASGGYVKRYTGYHSRRNEPVCINTFLKENIVTLKTSSVKDFPQIFAVLQDKIYDLGMSTDSKDVEKPTSFLEIGQPSPDLKIENRKLLVKKVLALAVQDAKEKFEATMAAAGVKYYKIASYSENSPHYFNAPGASEKGGGALDPIAPVEFDKLTVSKAVSVRFEFTGGDMNITSWNY